MKILIIISILFLTVLSTEGNVSTCSLIPLKSKVLNVSVKKDISESPFYVDWMGEFELEETDFISSASAMQVVEKFIDTEIKEDRSYDCQAIGIVRSGKRYILLNYIPAARADLGPYIYEYFSVTGASPWNIFQAIVNVENNTIVYIFTYDKGDGTPFIYDARKSD